MIGRPAVGKDTRVADVAEDNTIRKAAQRAKAAWIALAIMTLPATISMINDARHWYWYVLVLALCLGLAVGTTAWLSRLVARG